MRLSTFRSPTASEPLSIEERLTALEKAVRQLQAQLNRSVDPQGNVLEHIRGNYTLLVEGIAVLRSEAFVALSAPEVHLNPRELKDGVLRDGLPVDIPDKLVTGR